MNYLLAKELAEAGYTFPSRYGNLLQNPDCDGCAVEHKGAHKAGSNCLLMEPTLEELIEACGEEFENITYFGDGRWAANSDDMGHNGFEGPTPSNAVAKLWLALHTT